MDNVPRSIKSPWRFEHYVLKPCALAALVFGVILLISRIWVDAAIFIVSCFVIFGIAANIHWDSKTRTFPKDWHKDDLSGMDPETAKFRFMNAILSFSLLVGALSTFLHIRFHQEWYYTVLGGIIAALAAGVISVMVSIRPWPK